MEILYSYAYFSLIFLRAYDVLVTLIVNFSITLFEKTGSSRQLTILLLLINNKFVERSGFTYTSGRGHNPFDHEIFIGSHQFLVKAGAMRRSQEVSSSRKQLCPFQRVPDTFQAVIFKEKVEKWSQLNSQSISLLIHVLVGKLYIMFMLQLKMYRSHHNVVIPNSSRNYPKVISKTFQVNKIQSQKLFIHSYHFQLRYPLLSTMSNKHW